MPNLEDYVPVMKYFPAVQESRVADLGDIKDANNNELLEFDTVASAVNYVRIANAATGSGPTFSARGDDTNVDFNISPKGSGNVVVGTGSAAAVVESSGDYDLTLRTGNSTTSFITITDGANGNITANIDGTSGEFVVYNDDAGALGAVLTLYQDSASPAASDVCGRIQFLGEDSASSVTTYARIQSVIIDTTDTSEDGALGFGIMKSGTLTQHLYLDPTINGVVIGDGAATAILQSSGDFDLTLQTGNATSGTITITDGANANITVTPDGSGKIDLANAVLHSKTQALSGAGAVDVVSSITEWTTTGADAGTLADGTEGQMKFIVMVADGGDGTLTPTNLGGYSTITFNDVGDSVLLLFTNAAWYVIANQGCALA